MIDKRPHGRAPSLFYSLLLVVQFLGCGDPEVGEPQLVARPAKPTRTPVPVPTATPNLTEVDFASLETFPELVFDLSGSLSPDETRKVPVLDLQDPTEDRAWSAVAPATFELTLPPGAKIHRIDVEGTEGATGFTECVVFIQSATDTEWRRPSGLLLEQTMGEFVDGKGYRLRHVFTFDPVAAKKCLIGIAKGSVADPDKVSVRDIDVFGYLRN